MKYATVATYNLITKASEDIKCFSSSKLLYGQYKLVGNMLRFFAVCIIQTLCDIRIPVIATISLLSSMEHVLKSETFC